MFPNKDSFSHWRAFKQTKLLIMQQGLKTLKSNVNTHESFNCVWLPFSLYTTKTNLIVHSPPTKKIQGKVGHESLQQFAMVKCSVLLSKQTMQCTHLKIQQSVPKHNSSMQNEAICKISYLVLPLFVLSLYKSLTLFIQLSSYCNKPFCGNGYKLLSTYESTYLFSPTLQGFLLNYFEVTNGLFSAVCINSKEWYQMTKGQESGHFQNSIITY